MAVAVRPDPSKRFDHDAAEAALLFERYSERIFAYCLHVLRDRGEAEDAVQTTFLNAHRALQRGVTPEHEYAWLHTIAKNVCRTIQRTSGRRVSVAADVDVDAIPVEDGGDPDGLREALAEALSGLPDTQRRAVVLRELHGLTPLEIAPRLGLSVPATYAVLTRARRSLQSALTTSIRGPLSVLNLGVVGDLLRAAKTLLGGAAAKTAAAAVVATVTVGIGGAVERSVDDPPDRSSAPPAQLATAVSAPSFAATPGSGMTARPTGGGRSASLRDRLRPAREPIVGSSDPGSAPSASDPTTTATAIPTSSPQPAPADPHAPAPTDGEPPVAIPIVGGQPAPDLDDPLLPPLPPLPGVPPLLPELTPGDSLPPVEVPELPPVPEISVGVDVEPPRLPLP